MIRRGLGERSLLRRDKFDLLRSTPEDLSIAFGVRAGVLTQPDTHITSCAAGPRGPRVACS